MPVHDPRNLEYPRRWSPRWFAWKIEETFDFFILLSLSIGTTWDERCAARLEQRCREAIARQEAWHLARAARQRAESSPEVHS